MIGLIGELLVYSKLLSAIKKHLPENPPDLINIWQGWGNTARDFCFYRLDLEVKTTLRSSRIHHIGGFHQIEVSKREDGTADSIYLISVGLRPDPLDGDYSVVSLTEDILKQLSPDDQRAFLNNLRRYGQRSGDRGYDHETMSEDPKYLRKYSIQLEAKAYDVSDPEVKILRRDDIERSEFRDVVTNSVSFKIKLKDSDYSFNRDRIPQYNPLRLVEALDLLIPKHTPRAHPQ